MCGWPPEIMPVRSFSTRFLILTEKEETTQLYPASNNNSLPSFGTEAIFSHPRENLLLGKMNVPVGGSF